MSENGDIAGIPEQEVGQLAAVPTVGQRLRTAREARGLGIGDVVQALKFSQRQVEAVEADDLGALPGSVFVRGMIRSYARFLKLDPAPLLAQLGTEAINAPPDVRPPDNMGNAMPNGGIRQIPLLVVLSVLLLIAAAALIGWHFLGLRMQPEPVAEPPAAEALAAKPAEPGGVVTPVMPPQPVVEAQEGMAPAPAVAVPADARQMLLSFHGTSWVEIRDASKQIVLTGQYGAGAREAVSGRPPFQVVIGNSANVELRYGDQVVDLKPHTRAEVARLTLE